MRAHTDWPITWPILSLAVFKAVAFTQEKLTSKFKPENNFYLSLIQLHPSKYLKCCNAFSDSPANEDTKFTRRKDFRFYIWAVFSKVVVGRFPPFTGHEGP